MHARRMSSDEEMPLSAISKSGTTGIAPGRVKTVSAKQRQGQRIEDAMEERQRLLQAEEQAEEAAEEPGPPASSSTAAAAAEKNGAGSEDDGEDEGEDDESGEEGLIWDETHKDDENYLGDDVFKVESIRTKRRGPKGTTEYLIKWEGYASDVNSWEPAEHVGDEAISEYEAQQLLQRSKGRAFVTTSAERAVAAPPLTSKEALQQARETTIRAVALDIIYGAAGAATAELSAEVAAEVMAGIAMGL